MPKKDMGLKKKNLTGYMGGGVMYSKAPTSKSFRKGGTTKFDGGGFSDLYSNLTPEQKQSDTMKMYFANSSQKRPTRAQNPSKRRPSRPGGRDAGGITQLKQAPGKRLPETYKIKNKPRPISDPTEFNDFPREPKPIKRRPRLKNKTLKSGAKRSGGR